MKNYKNLYIIQGIHDGLKLSDMNNGQHFTGMKLDYNDALKLAIKMGLDEVAFIDHDLVGHTINVKTGRVTTYGDLELKKGRLKDGIYSHKDNLTIKLI